MIVVGAGTAGSLAAMTTAEAGFKVCIVERKKSEEIGEKVCGDALGEHHLKTLGLEKPQGGELEKRIEGIKIFSPDTDTIFTVEHEDFVGYLLNRHLFGQWLLRKAVTKGADLLDSTQCLKPIVEKGYVTGVSVKNMKTGKKTQIEGKVTVDSSGFVGIVRKNLPSSFGIENEVANHDVEACYREIRQLREENENTTYCEIYLNQKATPGGYSWIFPKSGARVNAGLGICMRGRFPNPKTQFYKHILTKPRFDGSLLLTAGAWYDPTRRPLDKLVGNGIALTGDAACLVNPIHGGGIGPSMLSGHFAGRTIVEALEKRDVSEGSLWPYACQYNEIYGGKQARLDIFRMLLLRAKDDDLNYGMRYHLLTEDDVLKAGLGDDFHLNITETSRRVFRGLKRIGFLNHLRLTVKYMHRVREHYGQYPRTSTEFGKWRLGTVALFKEASGKLLN